MPTGRGAHLWIQGPDGSTTTHEISGPGGLERFAVGEVGRRSSVWRIWAGKSKSDLYVAVRTLAGTQKYSFHESGDWRYQWTTAERAIQWTGTDARGIDRWRRPAEDRHGWTTALTIWVPHGELSEIQGRDKAGENAYYVPEPRPGGVMALRVIVARPDRGVAELKRALPICGFTLANGEIALVLAALRDMTDDQSNWLEEQRRRIGPGVIERLQSIPAEAPRMALFGSVGDTDRFVFDLDARRGEIPPRQMSDTGV